MVTPVRKGLHSSYFGKLGVCMFTHYSRTLICHNIHVNHRKRYGIVISFYLQEKRYRPTRTRDAHLRVLF